MARGSVAARWALAGLLAATLATGVLVDRGETAARPNWRVVESAKVRDFGADGAGIEIRAMVAAQTGKRPGLRCDDISVYRWPERKEARVDAWCAAGKRPVTARLLVDTWYWQGSEGIRIERCTEQQAIGSRQETAFTCFVSIDPADAP